MTGGGFAGYPLETAIADRAASCGLALSAGAVRALSAHARAVLEANPTLHLTTVVEPGAFVERHLGESFEGAALLPPDVEGSLLDLGSGNGYPGLAVAAARPRLSAVLVEASAKKARFLREVARESFPGVAFVEGQIQRAPDLEGLGAFHAIVTRALGGWERVLPRLEPALSPEGRVLLWAGADVDRVRTRAAWRRLTLETRRPLPGRERSWVWEFRRTRPAGA